MIVIDGRQSAMQLNNFSNLEEILVKVMEEEVVENHVITDVLVNKEAFTEVYPHHAEDVEVGEISSVEVRTVSMEEMAKDITQELFTVIKIMQNGSKGAAALMRRGDSAEGLEVLQDLLDVTRHFLNTISLLHQRFPVQDKAALEGVGNALSVLLTEMSDAMNEQDWLLLADLIEYEFQPSCDSWEQVLTGLAEDIAAARTE